MNGNFCIRDVSLRPPAHPDYDHGAAAPPPRWVLLDYLAFVADHPNATTTRGFTSTGQAVEVSFWAAPPPRVSYMCVHCPGLPPTKLALEPTIIRTEADLVLLRLAFGPMMNYNYNEHNEFFVYQATPTPSLHLIPNPAACGCDFADYDVGLLRCGAIGRPFALQPHTGADVDGGGFIIAALAGGIRSGKRDYVMHLYRSGSSSGRDGWTSHGVSIRGDVLPTCCYPTAKVITIGGQAGTLGWVEFNNGILFCDLLADGGPSLLRYLPLPPPINPLCTKNPNARRDIAVVKGQIKYVDLQPHLRQGWIINGAYVPEGWTAAVWSVAASNPWKEEWHQDCRLTASEVSVDDSTMHFELLPDLQEYYGGAPSPTLERLHTGHPQLSLLDDDVVYLMTKVAHYDPKAWVLAVDMRNKMLKDVAEFGAERTHDISVTFMNSRISEYLPVAAGICC